jgi:hypothetical protein
MERIGSIVVAPSTERKAEPGRFGAALKGAATRLANGIAGSVSLAAPFVPGGAVIAGALRPSTRSSIGSATLTSGAIGGAGEGDVMEATRALQLEAQNFNLQYLQLQESMQRESREFTSLTNVMKVKHDGAKAAINNIH